MDFDGGDEGCGDFGSAFSKCWDEDFRAQLEDNVRGPMEDMKASDPENAIGFMLLKWVCDEAEANGRNTFSYPTIPAGDWKCYADNEVNEGHPPYVEIYWGMYSDVEDKITLSRAVFENDVLDYDRSWGLNNDRPSVDFYPVDGNDPDNQAIW